MTVKPKRYIPNPSIYPGLTLAETLEAKGMSQAELARRLNKPMPAINEIVMGKKEIIAETAIGLERVLGIPANFWLRLERNYRESLARAKEEQELEKQVCLARKYPYTEMVQRGWVKGSRDATERVSELLNWLGVANLSLVKPQHSLVFRKSDKFRLSFEKLAVWLRHGELEAQKEKIPDFDNEKMSALLAELRTLTREEIDKASSLAKDACKKRGVFLVYTQEFKSFPVSGATRWFVNRPLVQVTLRFKTDDHFWFSIFHELGHVYLHGKRKIFLEGKGLPENDKEETKANEFASNNLIPREEYKEFVSRTAKFDANNISRFAAHVGISKGVVVGRLQHDSRIPVKSFNWMKQRLHWSCGTEHK